jgi:Carboxypeptidase regulatory-like domain
MLLPADARAQPLSVVSTGPGGTAVGAYANGTLAMTPDEHFVVFCSPANSLDPTKTDTNGFGDVYRRDLTTGVTTLVSVSTNGTTAGNGGCPSSSYARISTDGRYVAFITEATNLVSGITDSTANDIFVRDMQTGTTSLVTVNAGGTQAVGTPGGTFDLSDDGQRVAFESYATNIVTGFVDGNGSGNSDVFLRDLSTGTTELVSASRVSPTQSGDDDAYLGLDNVHTMSADGRYVAFIGAATDLVTGFTPIVQGVYVRDTLTNTTKFGGETYSAPGYGLTADGRWLVFCRDFQSIWVRDLQTDALIRVSVNAAGTGEGNGPSNNPFISRYPKTVGQQDYVVAFRSLASDLVSGVTKTPGSSLTIYARTLGGSTVLVGGVPDGTATGNGDDFTRDISPNGRYVIFTSTSTNLVAGVTDTNVADFFRRDLQTNTTTILTMAQPSGTTGVSNLPFGRAGDNGGVLFFTATPLLPADTNFATDLYFSGAIPQPPPPPTTFTISGQVRDLNDTGVAGVTMTLTGSANTTLTTDLDGHYAFPGLAKGGTYTVTPSKSTFTFTPPSQTFPNLQKDEVAGFFVANVGTFTRYFAEGATGGFFDTTIALLNATGSTVDVTVRFLKEDGTQSSQTLTMAGLARATVDPEQLAGTEAAAFSTIVESTQPIIADRRMEWDATHYGSHGETSIARPELTWYLAEGATTSSFNLYYLIQNPDPTQPANVEIRYLRPTPLPPIVKTYTIAPASRRTIYVNGEDPGLDEAEISAVVRSTNEVGIIVERAMYTNAGGQLFGAGHESAGIPNLATQWFLAEGATGPFFHLFILIANPNDQDAQIEARYLLPSGQVITKSYVAAANSRFTIGVHGEGQELAFTPVSTTVTSTNGVPVLVERAMWWPADAPEWYEGHNSAGVVASGEKWGLADGQNGGPFNTQTFILIANTSAQDATVEVKLIFEDGTTAVKSYTIAGNSRFNVHVPSEFPASQNRRFGAVVESFGTPPAQIVVERSVYSDANGVVFAAGANAPGTKLR